MFQYFVFFQMCIFQVATKLKAVLVLFSAFIDSEPTKCLTFVYKSILYTASELFFLYIM